MRCQLDTPKRGYHLVARKIGRKTVSDRFTSIGAMVRAAMAYRRSGYSLTTR